MGIDEKTRTSSDNDASLETIEAETHENEASKNTYGAVYTPDESGYYTCEKYSSVPRDELPSESAENAPACSPRSTKGGRRKNIAITLTAIILCVTLVLMSVIITAALTRNYFLDNYGKFENSGNATDNPWDDNRVNIDRSDYPDFTIESAEPGVLMSMESAISLVKDSVVEISTETVTSGFGGFSQYVVSGAGSGVIISSGGYIITNNHVIEGANNITVRLTNGKKYDAVLVGTDPMTDVAVLLIKPDEDDKLVTATMGTGATLSLGQTVIAIGNPLGELGGTVTDGIISSLAKEVAIDGSGTMTLLQTNAAVSPGNSGGGLFDLYGRLIGVVNAKSTGNGIEGISFAIPVDTAWRIAEELIQKGYVSGRPTIGVTLKQIEYGSFGQKYYAVQIADANGIDGLRSEDIIMSIDDKEIVSLADVSEIVLNHKIGDVVTVKVYRDRSYYDIKVTLIEYIPEDMTK